MRDTAAADEPSIAVLIPCYNEAVTIAKVVDDFRRKLPSALLAVAFVFAGLLSFSCGLILDTVVKGNRKAYELEVTRVYEEKRRRKG